MLAELKEAFEAARQQKIELDKEYQMIIEKQAKEKRRVWVPKTLCIASQYPFFDYFEAILQDLYAMLNDKDGLKNTIEAYVYRIVFQIDTPPKDKTVMIYNDIRIS